jgi:phosphate transport system substrate-binding protein
VSIPKTLFALVAAVALMLGVAACGDDDEASGADVEAPSDLSGTISLDGSSTVEPFAQAAAELIAEGSPDLEITVGAAGTSGGFEKFCAGEVDIADASRPIEAEEEQLCQEGNVEYDEVQVANDGVVVVTNPGLEISCLTTDQLAQLWSDDSVTNYSELGNDAETDEPLPDAEVSLYGPGTDSGTFDYFTEEINGEEGKSRKEYSPSEDDNVLVEGVSGDESGLGYFGFSYYEQNADSLNLVSVDAGDGCVEPSVETIQSGEYAPLARPLFMYPSKEAIAKPEVSGFMDFVVDNYSEIAETALIVPMDETQAEEARSNLDAAEQGSS